MGWLRMGNQWSNYKKLMVQIFEIVCWNSAQS